MADSQRRSGDEQPLRDLEEGQERLLAVALDVDSAGRSMSWPALLGFFFLTVNNVMAIYRSEGDRGAEIIFVAFSYADLILVFVCLRWFEQTAPADSSRRDRLKMAVWILTTLLTVAFAYRVATAMPLPMAALVCVMTAVALVGVYSAFSVHRAREQ